MEEFGKFSGQHDSDAYLVKWGVAGESKFYKAADADEAIKLISEDGWQPLSPVPVSDKPWEIIVKRPKQ
jgi:hypothetical protein